MRDAFSRFFLYQNSITSFQKATTALVCGCIGNKIRIPIEICVLKILETDSKILYNVLEKSVNSIDNSLEELYHIIVHTAARTIFRKGERRHMEQMNMQENARLVLGLNAAGWSEKKINDFLLYIETGEEQYKPQPDTKEKAET